MTKSLAALAALLFLTPALPARAEREFQSGYSTERTCYKDVYVEEYTPGTRDNPGTVVFWTQKEQTLCNPEGPHSTQASTPQPVDDNSCIEGAVLGGLAGGAGGAVLSRDEGNFIGIPLGVVAGALIGCQIDGG